eukprot:TRINITY_DN49022_c0_g1_i1.p1 TRINITY_DN49022_c0_g1~~TRINITY_DN49022_c0_g1_i1.p1  ORF type:complete len:300 (-),score=6.64 TRINITY_DN49022_c0_g1_i1:95-970(-)
MTWIREEYKFSLLERLFANILRSGRIPEHVAFIMDGNRRFARQHNIEKIKGHSQGFERLADTLQWCRYLGITTVTVYAFSIENFKRDQAEVQGLFELFREKIRLLIGEADKLRQHKVRVRIIGNLSYLPQDIQDLIREAEEITRDNEGSTLNVGFSYTSREEITHAVRSAVSKVQSGEIKTEDIDSHQLEKLLYSAPSRPVDLLVRTSGECRLSDFMLWQASSAITYFSEVLWPEFNFWQLLMAVFYYQRNMYLMDRLTSSTKPCSTSASLLDAEKRFLEVVEEMDGSGES